jgi:TRAP-type transport system periplasmic protein
MMPTPVTFGGYQPPVSILNRAAEIFGRTLHRLLGDQVAFRLDGNVMDAGHKAADLLTMVESGALSLCYFSSSYLSPRVPALAALDLPFVVARRETAYAALDGALGRMLTERLQAATGFRVLGYWDNGFRHLTSRIGPFLRPDDCRGQIIRTLFSDIHGETFRALGFEPVALDVKDLLAAIRQGTIDAEDNPLTNIFNFAVHEAQPFITLSAHFFGVALLLCHGASFDGWPAEMREAVRIAADEATVAQRAMAAAEDEAVLARLDPARVTVTRWTDDQRAAFTAAVAPVIARHRDALGDIVEMLAPHTKGH